MLQYDIAIFGSTGSIGQNALKVIDSLNDNGCVINVRYLSSHCNTNLLSEQADKYSPDAVIITDETAAKNASSKFHNMEVLSGNEALKEIASRDDYHCLLNALVGFSGLPSTIEAIKTGKRVALANKETLVVAGSLIKSLIKKYKAELIPIDSEHSAILQCLQGEKLENIKKLIITASGGPFRTRSKDELNNATIDEALKHPNWKMGNKITIDSATLMNKGLEVIEAHWLFDVNIDNIEVLIHPQSVIHSMVEFKDTSVKAQLGIPDMKIPIQYALTYPERIRAEFEPIDFRKFSELTFEQPDFNKFECLKLAYDVLRDGGTYPVVLNAANEVAITLFLDKKIKFLDIPEIIKKSLDKHSSLNNYTLDDVIYTDNRIRAEILNNNYC